jgi:hypothetical protein
VCASSASTGLCGGQRAIAVPTATGPTRRRPAMIVPTATANIQLRKLFLRRADSSIAGTVRLPLPGGVDASARGGTTMPLNDPIEQRVRTKTNLKAGCPPQFQKVREWFEGGKLQDSRKEQFSVTLACASGCVCDKMSQMVTTRSPALSGQLCDFPPYSEDLLVRLRWHGASVPRCPPRMTAGLKRPRPNCDSEPPQTSEAA